MLVRFGPGALRHATLAQYEIAEYVCLQTEKFTLSPAEGILTGSTTMTNFDIQSNTHPLQLDREAWDEHEFALLLDERQPQVEQNSIEWMKSVVARLISFFGDDSERE